MIPELRFPEFNADWQKAEIGWFLQRSTRPVRVQQDRIYREIGVRSHGKGIFHKTADLGESLGDKRVFWVVPDALVLNIVFAWEQAVAVTSTNEEGFIASHRFPMFLARDERADTRFARDFFLRPRGKWLLGLASPGGAGRNKTLGQSDFTELKVVWPSRTEQQKIADFFGAIDARIALLTRKAEALMRYKLEIVRRLFARELRFRRDDGSNYREWENVHLRDVATFAKGRNISKDDIAADGETPCIRYGELYTAYAERIDSVISRTDVPAHELLLSKGGEVILPASGETPLDMASASYVSVPGVALGGDINVIRSKLDGLFLAYLLRGPLRRSVGRLAQGNSVVHLYSSHLAGLALCVPSDIEEQRRISTYLSVLDDKIDAIRSKAAAMQTFKKGLLQKMFV